MIIPKLLKTKHYICQLSFFPSSEKILKKHDLLVNKRYNWWTIGWSSPTFWSLEENILKNPRHVDFSKKKKYFKKNCIFLFLWENIFKKYTKCVSVGNICYYLGIRKNILKNPRFLGHLFYYKNNDLLMLKRKYF